MRFEQQRTNIVDMINSASDMFENHAGASDTAKLLVILSDGRFTEDFSRVVPAVRRAKMIGVSVVYIVMDNPKSDKVREFLIFTLQMALLIDR